MKETKGAEATPGTQRSALSTGVRKRQTIKLNESTNEATPRKGIQRRTDIGDAPAAPAPSTAEKE